MGVACWGVAPLGLAPSPPPGAPRPRSAVRDGAMARAGAGPPRELSLEEVLKCYEQPLNEEQAWALCFQGCRAAAAAPVAPAPLRTADIRLRADGSLRLPAPPHGERRHRRGGRERAAPGLGGDGTAPPSGVYRGLPGLTGIYRGLRAPGLAGVYRGASRLTGTESRAPGFAGTGNYRHRGSRERRGLPRFSGAYRHRHPGHRDLLALRLIGAYRHWERDTGAHQHRKRGTGSRALELTGTGAFLLQSLAAQGTGIWGLPARGHQSLPAPVLTSPGSGMSRLSSTGARLHQE